MRTYILLLLVITSISACTTFPQYKEGANNKVIVNGQTEEDCFFIEPTRSNKNIIIADSVEVNNLLYLREGKGITCTNGHNPLFLCNKKKLKLQFIVNNVSIFEENQDEIPELLVLANSFFDKLLLGIEVSLHKDFVFYAEEITIDSFLNNPCYFSNSTLNKNIIRILVSDPISKEHKA